MCCQIRGCRRSTMRRSRNNVAPRSGLTDAGIRLDATLQNGAKPRHHLCLLKARQQSRHVSHAMARQLTCEFEILLPARDVLRNGQIVNLQAESRNPGGVRIQDRHETRSPVLWKDRGLFTDPLRVVSERLVKSGALADAAVDQVRALRMVQGGRGPPP